MSDPKNQKPSTPDSLTKASKAASIELSEGELKQVAGGQKNKTEEFLKIKLTDVLITGY
jgi:type VI protein secretion system component Hcp